MAKKYGPQIKKLQRAINEKYGEKLLVNKTQFFSERANKPIEIIIIKKAIWDEEKQKHKNIEIFSSTSDVQIVLWLRDYWYGLNGWEVPTDNQEWNRAKEQYYKKREPTNIDVTIKDNKKHIIREDAYDELKK